MYVLQAGQSYAVTVVRDREAAEHRALSFLAKMAGHVDPVIAQALANLIAVLPASVQQQQQQHIQLNQTSIGASPSSQTATAASFYALAQQLVQEQQSQLAMTGTHSQSNSGPHPRHAASNLQQLEGQLQNRIGSPTNTPSLLEAARRLQQQQQSQTSARYTAYPSPDPQSQLESLAALYTGSPGILQPGYPDDHRTARSDPSLRPTHAPSPAPSGSTTMSSFNSRHNNLMADHTGYNLANAQALEVLARMASPAASPNRRGDSNTNKSCGGSATSLALPKQAPSFLRTARGSSAQTSQVMNSSDSRAQSESSELATSPRDTVRPSSNQYKPLPTRSGRVPIMPADPSNPTFNLNSFFEFPSDSDSDDPDFQPGGAEWLEMGLPTVATEGEEWIPDADDAQGQHDDWMDALAGQQTNDASRRPKRTRQSSASPKTHGRAIPKASGGATVQPVDSSPPAFILPPARSRDAAGQTPAVSTPDADEDRATPQAKRRSLKKLPEPEREELQREERRQKAQLQRDRKKTELDSLRKQVAELTLDKAKLSRELKLMRQIRPDHTVLCDLLKVYGHTASQETLLKIIDITTRIHSRK
ncbi:uncharacterized protein L969DRAFT_105639 [Mixia osmundae IAM 14324]|uniref:BZIP domain-containing protein n=1 Tax=Mixia osmundae (strain CBS 9802 / IAM 14324 / JCM 22182 / KY 12970) TaxID=764103 RepID=G7E2M5_MIXOS|nr:uncharacterized protein L969DRAFT_105639 [Mixia osmundae IAM 14324]KEI36950.1 hypothetical protein L969DRAFT_105639 [Mixia osmundae IAM 14324]GAA97085.1 hypothetical protein E5Q_03760 [Mixia osmundae IAM 14324]